MASEPVEELEQQRRMIIGEIAKQVWWKGRHVYLDWHVVLTLFAGEKAMADWISEHIPFPRLHTEIAENKLGVKFTYGI